MAIYRYRAYDSTGKTVVEQFSANSRQEVLAQMEKRKLYPVRVSKVVNWKAINRSFSGVGKKVTLEETATFCRQFYTLFHAGIPIPECVHTIAVQTTHAEFGKILLKLQEKLEEGNTLSASLSCFPEVFPRLLISMVETGETAGFLEDVLMKMAVFYEKEHKIKVRMESAAVYPKFLAVLSAALVLFMLVFVMPGFASMFKSANVPLPGITRAFIAIGDFFRYNVFLAISTSVFLWITAMLMRKSKLYHGIADFFEWARFKIPVLRDTMIKGMAARFAGAMSMLLKSGIPMVQALEVTSKVMGNKRGERAILEISEKIDRGVPLSAAVHEAGLFPPMMAVTVRTGEGSGALDEVLEHTSRYFEEELDKSLERMLKLIEPLMIVVMAAVIGVIVIAMILPMFDMISAIR